MGDPAHCTARRHDMTGKHRERREIPLIRVQVSGGEDKVVPKRECRRWSQYRLVALEGPGELHLEMQQTAFDGFSLADGTISSKQGGAFYF